MKSKENENNDENISFWSLYFVEIVEWSFFFFASYFGDYLNSDNILFKSKDTSRMET